MPTNQVPSKLGARPLIVPRVVYWLAAIEAVIGSLFGLLSAGQDLFARSVVVRLPVDTFWPVLKPTVHIDSGPTATVTGGGFAQASVTLTGLGLDARLLLAAGHLLQGAVIVSIGIAIAVLCSRLVANEAFAPIVSKTAFVTAVTVAVCGLAAQVFAGFGGLAASRQALNVTGWRMNDADVVGDDLRAIGWPHPASGFSLDFWPIGFGLAIVALALAFRYGEKLQRDMERLRQEKQALQRDTDGLV